MPQEYRDLDVGTGGDPVADAINIGAIGGIGGGNGGAPEPERKPGKRRGRPPGSSNGGASKGTGKEKARNSLDLSSLTGLFVGLHVIAAGATNVPEVAIDMSEGEQFMKSAQNVMRHYSVESSQKTIDWLAFGGVCCMIYGTRFGSYMLRKRTEKVEQSNIRQAQYFDAKVDQGMQQRGHVVPMRQPQPAQPVPQPEQEVSHVVPEMEFEGE